VNVFQKQTHAHEARIRRQIHLRIGRRLKHGQKNYGPPALAIVQRIQNGPPERLLRNIPINIGHYVLIDNSGGSGSSHCVEV
jgi:hypothetical protein